MQAVRVEWPEPSSVEWDPGRFKAQYGETTSLRNEPRVMVRFDCTSANGLAIPGGPKAEPGENVMLIYARDLPRLRAMLPTDEERQVLAMAKRLYEKQIDVAVEKAYRGPKVGLEYEAARRAAMDSTGYSVEAEYHRLMNPNTERSTTRAYPPIDNLVVRDGPVAPPETPQAAAQRADERLERLGQTIANAVVGAVEKRPAAKG